MGVAYHIALCSIKFTQSQHNYVYRCHGVTSKLQAVFGQSWIVSLVSSPSMHIGAVLAAAIG